MWNMEKGKREATGSFLNLYLSYMFYIPSAETGFEWQEVWVAVSCPRWLSGLHCSSSWNWCPFYSAGRDGRIEGGYFTLF